jgi:pyrroline-5-carboxylate reductase
MGRRMADSGAPQNLTAPQARELAQHMLLGQHSVSYAAEYTGMAPARVEDLARKLHAAKRIPKVRP